jgi:NAD-dependent SIR2 family protein deacetylase
LYPVIAEARPTITHYFIKLLNDKGILLKHYTQNIDGLENETGLSQDKTIQAHGHIR